MTDLHTRLAAAQAELSRCLLAGASTIRARTAIAAVKAEIADAREADARKRQGDEDERARQIAADARDIVERHHATINAGLADLAPPAHP